MWAFIFFLVIATLRPAPVRECPVGQVYDSVKKACVDRLADRDLSRGDAQRGAPEIGTPPGEGPDNPPGPPGPPGPGDDKPGYGHGDPNHGHTGPPGRNK